MMDLNSISFLSCLAVIAFCYAAVGHGGASGYIAVFALFGLVSSDMKSLVLMMNLLVAMIAFIQYYREGHFRLNYFLPFGLGAAPMAFLGASFKISAGTYNYLLAAFLLFSVAYLIGLFDNFIQKFKIDFSIWKAVLIAMVLGFISGMTGVGGGIFLSPILLLLGWLNVKETATIAALFIIVNSLAGLIAIVNLGVLITQALVIKLILVGGFGYFGAKWGAKMQNTTRLKQMLAFVLLIAAVKLCFI
jgi:hypothetical protein